MNDNMRKIHNIKVVQSKAGWTMAQVTKAIVDAKAGVEYSK